MNIAIITSGHLPFDERIFYKFAISFKENGFKVQVISSAAFINEENEGIKLRGIDGTTLSKKEKVKYFYNELIGFEPDIVICCEPLTILAANKYKKHNLVNTKIVSDITEYYPHQNMLIQYSGIKRIFHFMKYSLFNLYVSNLTDYLLIGEVRKAKFYKLIAPTIKQAIIGYYPPLKYFRYSKPNYDNKNFTVCYTGIISKQRGFPRFVSLVQMAAEHFPDKNFIVKIIGRYENPDLKNLTIKLGELKNVKINFKDWVNYKYFSDELNEVDLCIDLRDKDKIYNRSLPIKIFDYMACGKPVIYSNLDSLIEIEDVNKFAFLVEPDELDKALGKISFYLKNPERLKEDSRIARKLFEEKYTWESIEVKLIEIISSLPTQR